MVGGIGGDRRIVDLLFKACYHRSGMEQNQQSFWARRWGNVRQILLWFVPGLGVKRWFLAILIGTMMIAVGLAYYLLDFYRTTPEPSWLPILSAVSLRFLPRLARVAVFGGIGLSLITVGIYQLNRSILRPFIQPGRPLVDTLTRYRRLDRGPRVVVIGGGHGQATLLRGMKKFTRNLTAIVTVADDGGSSGRLRNSLGILPPGDIRNCLAALSNDEDLLTQLFQYRFQGNGDELDGHSFGNLLISALSEITGSFEDAVAESGRVLSVYGQVLPSTLHDVRLVADKSLPHIKREVRVRGESHIPKVSGQVRHLWLEPNNPPAFPSAVHALLQAELIVIGPGSLYTSILPNLLVPDISAAIRASQAFKIFVCNLVTQPGETEGYSCQDHVQAIEDHIGSNFFELIISNRDTEPALPEGLDWVLTGQEFEDSRPVYQTNLADHQDPGKHDPEKLAQALIDLYQERTGPLAE